MKDEGIYEKEGDNHGKKRKARENSVVMWGIFTMSHQSSSHQRCLLRLVPCKVSKQPCGGYKARSSKFWTLLYLAVGFATKGPGTILPNGDWQSLIHGGCCFSKAVVSSTPSQLIDSRFDD